MLPDDTKKLEAMYMNRKGDLERNYAFLATLGGNARTARTQKLLSITPLVLHRELSDPVKVETFSFQFAEKELTLVLETASCVIRTQQAK